MPSGGGHIIRAGLPHLTQGIGQPTIATADIKNGPGAADLGKPVGHGTSDGFKFCIVLAHEPQLCGRQWYWCHGLLPTNQASRTFARLSFGALVPFPVQNDNVFLSQLYPVGQRVPPVLTSDG
jgi:hypothetical protein